ncbi:MAG: hypothetical protein ACFFBS_09570 [Promethearchaeota archaeon]
MERCDLKIVEEHVFKEIESEIFKFSTTENSKLIPENKKYWEVQKDGTAPVFLKLE